MSAEITPLRRPAGAESDGMSAARRYVALAEDALRLVPLAADADQRQAICRIGEAWLALAEAELNAVG
jgi:hypothetical protein